MDKEFYAAVLAVLAFAGMLVYGAINSSNKQHECRLATIEKSYQAIEIQAICK